MRQPSYNKLILSNVVPSSLEGSMLTKNFKPAPLWSVFTYASKVQESSFARHKNLLCIVHLSLCRWFESSLYCSDARNQASGAHWEREGLGLVSRWFCRWSPKAWALLHSIRLCRKWVMTLQLIRYIPLTLTYEAACKHICFWFASNWPIAERFPYNTIKSHAYIWGAAPLQLHLSIPAVTISANVAS